MKDYNRLLEEERVFIATGARGTGKDIALSFAQQGTQVGVEGRNLKSLAKTMEEVRVYPLESRGYVMELSSEGQVEQTTGQVFEDTQGVDILVNTVGINIHGRTGGCSDGLLERMLETNYKSGPRFFRRFIPGMMERRYGIIINISSVHSVAIMPGFEVYAGTKGAINATARAMALGYTDYSIRVNIIYPGLIMSDNMINKVYGCQEDPEGNALMEMLNHIQLLAPGETEDISGAALYLASDMSSYVTGQVIMVDGRASIKAHQRGRGDELF